MVIVYQRFAIAMISLQVEADYVIEIKCVANLNTATIVVPVVKSASIENASGTVELQP